MALDAEEPAAIYKALKNGAQMAQNHPYLALVIGLLLLSVLCAVCVGVKRLSSRVKSADTSFNNMHKMDTDMFTVTEEDNCRNTAISEELSEMAEENTPGGTTKPRVV